MAKGKDTPSGISKADAIRRAMEKLPDDCKAGDVVEYVKLNYNLDVTPAQVYNLKSESRTREREEAPPPPPATTSPPAALPQTQGRQLRLREEPSFTLPELEAVRDLKIRLGSDTIRRLLDLLESPPSGN